jgi:hypothetical protein
MTTTERQVPAAVPESELRLARWLYPLLTLALAVLLFGFEIHDHGRTADDKVQRERGEAVLRFLTTFDRDELPDPSQHDFSKGDRLYGPLAATLSVAAGRLIARLAGKAGQQPHFEFHAGLTLWALLLFAGVQRLGLRCLRSALGGALAGLVLVAMPRILGLLTVNPSDLPAVATAAAALVALAAWLEEPRLGRSMVFAGWLGATAAIRAQNGALLALAALAGLVASRTARTHLRVHWRQVGLVPLAAFGCWILLWPDFWFDPLGGPLAVVRGFFAEQQRWQQTTLWFGAPAVGPPLYSVVWLGITTPLWLLAAALPGACWLRRQPIFPALLALFLLSWLKHLSGVGNTDGIRHFLDAYVPLAIFAAAGVLGVARWLQPRLGPGLACLAALAAVAFARGQHPYESCWFNALAGGARGAAGRFDLEPDGATMLVLLRALRPHLTGDSVVIVPGQADLVRQIDLPANVVVFEALPQSIGLLRLEASRKLLDARTVFVVTIQDRRWGAYDRLLDDQLLELVVSVGPDDLPLGLAMRVRDARFYERAEEIFR